MADAGRWVDGPVLPWTDPPPPGAHLVAGAVLIRVYTVTEAAGQRRRKGHTEAVILARYRLPGGAWALLAAWQGAWQENGHTTGRARWGWVLAPTDPLLAEPVTPAAPLTRLDGFQWHGWHEDSQLAIAVREAAESLPQHLRAIALQPKPPDTG